MLLTITNEIPYRNTPYLTFHILDLRSRGYAKFSPFHSRDVLFDE